MKVPSKVCLFGDWIKIKYVDHIEAHDNAFLHGEYCPATDVIQIRLDEPDFMHKVIIHELTHAMLIKSGWAEKLGNKTEEALCFLLENFGSILCFKGKKTVRWKNISHAKTTKK